MAVNFVMKGIHFSYNGTEVLRDVALDIGAGEVVSLVGPNGSGKSTLLRCINRVLKPKKGAVFLGERDLKSIPRKEMARLIGHVPQSMSTPFPTTVYDTVLMGRRPHLTWGIGARDREIVAEILILMGLKEMAMRGIDELSGGERQKAFIARALAQEPTVLLLDEPTSNLDLKHQLDVLALVRTTAKARGMSVVMAIHDLNLAARFSDRIAFLRKGEICAIGRPAAVLTAENIRDVYGVAAIVNGDSGQPHVVPVATV